MIQTSAPNRRNDALAVDGQNTLMAEPVRVGKKTEAAGVDKAIGGHFADEIKKPICKDVGEIADITDPAESLTPEQLKAKKRAEIEAKVAAMKLQQSKEEEQRANYFGDHAGITCDGCASAIVGYRYKCKDCANHDVCETCYDQWVAGKVTNSFGKQTISLKPEDHRLCLHKDKNFSSLVKKPDGDKTLTEKKVAKTKPNDPCTCGSGKKYKKCCGAL